MRAQPRDITRTEVGGRHLSLLHRREQRLRRLRPSHQLIEHQCGVGARQRVDERRIGVGAGMIAKRGDEPGLERRLHGRAHEQRRDRADRVCTARRHGQQSGGGIHPPIVAHRRPADVGEEQLRALVGRRPQDAACVPLPDDRQHGCRRRRIGEQFLQRRRQRRTEHDRAAFHARHRAHDRRFERCARRAGACPERAGGGCGDEQPLSAGGQRSGQHSGDEIAESGRLWMAKRIHDVRRRLLGRGGNVRRLGPIVGRR
jgi:hypothetical protein